MSIPFDPNATGTELANTDVVITFAAVVGRSHVIHSVEWSYTAAPTGGALTITVGGTTVLSLDITAAGPGSISFDPPKKALAGVAVVVTLAAGSGAVVGKLNVGHTTEV